MDRLLSGDVGFGKTEVAMNALLAIVLDDKQALFVCPTTILATQHYHGMQKKDLNSTVYQWLNLMEKLQQKRKTILKKV